MNIQPYIDNISPKEKITYLKLVLSGPENKECKIIVVDKNGEAVRGGNILSFLTDGRIYMHNTISSVLGFDLNDLGQVKIK